MSTGTGPRSRLTGAVTGWCPMGCGQHLHLTASGRVACTAPGCPQPAAVTRLLASPETEHIVTFDALGFTILHPLRERLDDALLTCALQGYCGLLDDLPVPPGRYRAVPDAGQWSWLPLEPRP
jgi:hypothetical protein